MGGARNLPDPGPSLQTLSLTEPPKVFQQIRLVATDVDGTLTVDGRFPAETVQALADLHRVGLRVLLITGRSAGWVQGLRAYLPVSGAIAENGGVLLMSDPEPLRFLCAIPDLKIHRQELAQVFALIQREFRQYPSLKEAKDNVFRLTDWTFDAQGFTVEELYHMAQICRDQGYGFTYSSVQCHIKPLDCDKGSSLLRVITEDSEFQCSPNQVVTVGDSPNDQSLFDRSRFPISVGVANVLDYQDHLSQLPAYITSEPEGGGFHQLARILLSQSSSVLGS